MGLNLSEEDVKAAVFMECSLLQCSNCLPGTSQTAQFTDLRVNSGQIPNYVQLVEEMASGPRPLCLSSYK